MKANLKCVKHDIPRCFHPASSKEFSITLMRPVRGDLRPGLRLVAGLCLAALLTGCGSIKVSRTVGLTGMTPLASPSQVKVVESGKAVSEPYQVVGKATVYRVNGGVSKGYSTKRMKEIAAGMGADGLIGIREGFGSDPRAPTCFRSALAVKWLAPGEARRPVAAPFMVGLLPVGEDPEAPGNQAKITEAVSKAVVAPLEVKGYYVLPPGTLAYKGGIEGARELKEAELQALGGDDAHLLLEVAFVSRGQAHIIIGAGATAEMKATLMNKATRTNVFEGTGAGQGYTGWLLNMTTPNAKRIAAATIGADYALHGVKPIHEELPK
jgi:hypothetical protein